MHPQARHFTEFVKRSLPSYFLNKKVLDVGSGDINGNNRFLFEGCEYHGNDVIEGRNVTIVSSTKNLTFDSESFDTIVSTECFEHDPEFLQSINKIYELLKPGGLFFFTCAGEGRREHGTRRTSPQDSFGTLGKIVEMQDYYKNITNDDFKAAINLNESFSHWNSYYNYGCKDYYFLGIKKSINQIDITLPIYNAPSVIKY